MSDARAHIQPGVDPLALRRTQARHLLPCAAGEGDHEVVEGAHRRRCA